MGNGYDLKEFDDHTFEMVNQVQVFMYAMCNSLCVLVVCFDACTISSVVVVC